MTGKHLDECLTHLSSIAEAEPHSLLTLVQHIAEPMANLDNMRSVDGWLPSLQIMQCPVVTQICKVILERG